MDTKLRVDSQLNLQIGTQPTEDDSVRPSSVAGAGTYHASELDLPAYADWSDAKLVRCYVKQKSPDVFRQLVVRYGALVLNVCRQNLHRNDLAEDAFQETFIVLANKAQSIRSPEMLSSWLYGVAQRVSKTAFKKLLKESSGKVYLSEEIMAQYSETDNSTEDLDGSIGQALKEAIDQLPDSYRAPIVLCYFMGNTQIEAANKLGMPIGSMSTKLRIAKSKIKKALKRMGFAVPIATIVWLLGQMQVEADIVGEGLVNATIAKATSTVGSNAAVSNATATNAAASSAGVSTFVQARSLAPARVSGVLVMLLLTLAAVSAVAATEIYILTRPAPPVFSDTYGDEFSPEIATQTCNFR